MEDGGEGGECIGAGGLDLTHHVDQDGAGLTDRNLDVGTLEIGADLAADATMGCLDGKTADMDGTEVGDGDIAIGADRQGMRLLRGAVDIDDELVARTEDIVLRRGDVHLGLEGERLVVEDVTAEDALAHRRRLPFDEFRGIGTLMGDYLIIGHFIIDTHAILGVTNGVIDIAVETAVGDLLGILTAQALDLLHRGTTLDQTRGNLGF